MLRVLSLLLPLPLLMTGCYTYTQASGAVGKVVEADTGAPIQGARITRPYIDGRYFPGGPKVRMGVPLEGLPEITVLSDKNGHFDLPPATGSQSALVMQLHNPETMSESVVISEGGHATINLQGFATSRTRWRVDFGRVLLEKR
jgi:hypothetical protein